MRKKSTPNHGQHRTPADGKPQADLIYDVGAHLGEDSDFYLKLGYRVVAVEAAPELAAKLRDRFADQIVDGRFILIEKVIAPTSGETDFYVNDKASVWGTAVPAWADRNERVGAPSQLIRVPSVSFDGLLRGHGIPHYLKVDIEGADMLCVEALAQFDARPDYLSIESGEGSWRSIVDEFTTLEKLGYRRFQIVSQGRHKAGRFRPLNGPPIDYSFTDDASGPFGRHLPGKWQTRRQALRRYRWIFLRTRLVSDDRFPGSILRRIPLLRRLCGLAGWHDTHAAL